MECKDRIKEAIEMAEVFGKYGIEVGRGGKVCCPFHEEKTPSCVVHSDRFHCFGCDAKGDVFDFVMRKEGVEFVEAMEIVGEMAGIECEAAPANNRGVAQANKGVPEFTKKEIYDVLERLAAWYGRALRTKAGAEALEYCKERGLSDEWIKVFGIGYSPKGFAGIQRIAKRHGISNALLVAAGICGVKDGGLAANAYSRFQDRLMFPIYNRRGKVCGFSGRKLPGDDSKSGKYINTASTAVYDKSSLLYGLKQAESVIRKTRSVVIVEGQIDVIACAAQGVGNAVAPLGTAFTDAQAKILCKMVDEVVLCMDADKGGIEATSKAIEMLMKYDVRVRVAVLPAGKDPGGMLEGK